MSGLMSRNKGKDFERTIAKAFRMLYPTAKRTLTQQRDSGEAPDVEIPDWWLECKAHKVVSIRKAFEQAVDEVTRANSRLKPAAVTKDNGKEVLVTIQLTTFLDLLKELEASRADAKVVVFKEAPAKAEAAPADWQQLGA